MNTSITQHAKGAAALPAGTLAASNTGNSGEIDTLGFRELAVVVDFGAMTGNYQLQLSSSATAGGSKTAHAATAITVSADKDNTTQIVRWLIANDSDIERYVQVNHTIGAAGSCVVSGSVVVLAGVRDTEFLPDDAEAFVYNGADDS